MSVTILSMILHSNLMSWVHKNWLTLIYIFKGEYHANNPEMSKLLHKAVRQKSQSAFSVYQQHLANRPVNVSPEDPTFMIVLYNFCTTGLCEIFFYHFRFSVIFLSLKVIVLQYLWGRLNLLHVSCNGFALAGCHLELFQEKLTKQLQLQWTD